MSDPPRDVRRSVHKLRKWQRQHTDPDEPETHRCGVNDCSREVDSPEATCWQHS